MKKIALVEDNPDNRLLVRVILDPLYEVCDYETGPRALEGIRAKRPDLLLLDISLPGMDGVEVLKEIRADPELKDLPVIALTAHAMAGDREKYLELGFDDYISKPIIDEKLMLDAIEHRLSPRQDGREPASVHDGPCPTVDRSALERLRKLGGDSFTAEMIGVFLEYTAQKIAQGCKADAAGDRVGVQRAVHPIKSSAGNVGAGEIKDLASRIEQLAMQESGGPLGGLLAELNKAFNTAKPQFERTQKLLLGK